MVASEDRPPQQKEGHFFIHPQVIEAHLQRGTPIPMGTVKLLLAMKLLETPKI